MAIGSSIEWTDATWNPVAGCTPVSPGCKNCYAARLALRLETMGGATERKYAGTARRSKGGQPVFTGKIVLDRDALELPTRWRLPRVIFVNSMSDVFHERVPLSYIKSIFRVMENCPQHTFQVLTKRPHRALELYRHLPWPKNIWLGTSVENDEVIERVDLLRQIPAGVRFLSCEPLLGPLNSLTLDDINWVIVGGESGPGCRPMDIAWVLDIKERCEMAGAPFFFKQWGGTNKKKAGRELEGRTWDALPDATLVTA